MALKAVILAGGMGSRLWPLSRELYPKQLLNLVGDHSLLQATINRALSVGVVDIILVASHPHRFYVREQIEELSLPSTVKIDILLESEGKNTAPAIALAALHAQPDDDLWVMPADHILRDDQLSDKLQQAQLLSRQSAIVTFGIPPTHAAIDYGYIQKGKALKVGYTVKSFKEKPQLDQAEYYIKSGEYCWNSGLFCFQAQTILSELQCYCPEIYAVCTHTYASHYHDLEFIKFPEDIFSQCLEESIDIAVLEKSSRVVVIPLTGQWSDIGTWDALYNIEAKDASGNVTQGDVVLLDSQNSLVKSTSRMVAALGIKDLVVVETSDAVLISNRLDPTLLKQLLTILKQKNRCERRIPTRVQRVWGHYELLSMTDQCEIRQVTLAAGKAIESHHQNDRAKQWMVLLGRVKMTIDGESHYIDPLHSCSIPMGSMHSMLNGGDVDVIAIEIRIHQTAHNMDSVNAEEVAIDVSQ